MKNISRKFAKTLDKRILPCYNDAVARISAEAHGTLMITVSDLHGQGTVDGEPGTARSLEAYLLYQ